jgi:hypothetical protein
MGAGRGTKEVEAPRPVLLSHLTPNNDVLGSRQKSIAFPRYSSGYETRGDP